MESAILDATHALFVERGVDQVSVADVAAAVGLKRNSLYRYVPNKDHLVLRWFERECARHAAAAADDLGGAGDPRDRLSHWVDQQLDFATDPNHAVTLRLLSDAGSLQRDTRAQIAAGHRRLYAELGDVVSQILGPPRAAEAPLITALIGEVLNAGSRQLIAGADDAAVRAAVHRANAALLD